MSDTTQNQEQAPVTTPAPDAPAAVTTQPLDLDAERREKAAARQRRKRARDAEIVASSQPPVTPNTIAIDNALIKRNEDLLRPAIAETLELLADAVHLFVLEPSDPRFGAERSKRLGDLWARVAAPYLDAELMKWFPATLAGVSTAAAVTQWAKQVAEARKAPVRQPLGIVRDTVTPEASNAPAG